VDGACRGKRPAFIGGLGFVGDGGVTAKMPLWSSPSVAARTTATPPSDPRSVARSRERRGRDGTRPLEELPGLGALLTPKIGIREGLICGPESVTNPAQWGKIFSRRFGKGACGRQFVSVRQRDCLR
jgi:hypothetical protein